MPESSPNPYLDGLPRRPAVGGRRILGLWVPLVVVVVVLWSLASGHVGLDWVLPELFAVLCALGLVLRGRRAGTTSRELSGVERLVLRGDHVNALAAGRALLQRRTSGYDRARALLLLGQVAEARADFAEAAEVYGEASAALPRRRGLLGMAFAQLAPVVGARRAFCLAAAGRLDQADTVLQTAHHRDEYPGVRALVVRARALIHARRGEHRQLVELASNEHVRIKNGLVHRDRVLMRVLLGWGQSCVGGAFRSPPPPALTVDAELRSWIARAVPEAATVLEAP